MPDKVSPGPIHGAGSQCKEAVCIHTKKVYDACKDKDCCEDLRVYPTRCGQNVLDRAINVKCRNAELIWAYIDVEPIPFNRGFFTIDVKFFYRITVDAFCGVGRPTEVTGLATFDKRVVLFGSEGNVRIFTSKFIPGTNDRQRMENDNLPTAVVEVVDPICLGVKLVEHHECGCHDFTELAEVPECVGMCFDDELVLSSDGKRLFVTIGQFSIIKLERDTQLLIPAFDFCIPEKECAGSTEDPCTLFASFKFPVSEFFPPDMIELGGGRDRNKGCCRD